MIVMLKVIDKVIVIFIFLILIVKEIKMIREEIVILGLKIVVFIKLIE